MLRRTFLTLTTTAAVAALPGCGGGGSGGEAASASPPATVDPATVHVASLSVDATAGGTPVNRRVLGSNVQWVDRGDNLLDAAGSFDPTLLGLVRTLSPTVLRYPGGLQSDTFHFEQATNEHAFTRALQPTLMNPQRLLELCESTGAEPLFTVNVVTGGADEAARWVRAANVSRLVSSATGRTLPRVDFWEIGNEPYLKVDSRPDLDIAPAEFARRANAFIAAMRAVDPSIRIGIPVTLDSTNGLAITAYPNYTRSVLGAITERFDFVSVHNAYLPLVFGSGRLDIASLTPAALAAAESVRDSFAALRSLLAELRPGAVMPLAVTEHAPLFSLGLNTSTVSTDDWSTTPLGAIYLADLLRVFAETPDLLLANHWSLSGNGRFGAIGGTGGTGAGAAFNRAAADVLGLAGRALRGNRLDATVVCDSIATPSVGLVSARAALPLLSAAVCRDGNTLRALLVHKDASRNAQLRVGLKNASATSASLTTLAAADLTAAADLPNLWQRATASPAAGTNLDLNLPPHSVALLELTL